MARNTGVALTVGFLVAGCAPPETEVGRLPRSWQSFSAGDEALLGATCGWTS